MWTIRESASARKTIAKLQPQVRRKYEAWYALVQIQGPSGLRDIKSFHDEKLSGPLAHQRSSRLSDQWRIIYEVKADIVTVDVVRIGPHDY